MDGTNGGTYILQGVSTVESNMAEFRHKVLENLKCGQFYFSIWDREKQIR